MIRYLALALLLAGPAYSQPMCAGTADVQAELYKGKFKAANEGQLAPDAKVTVYTSEGGDFIVIVEQGPQSCIVATGKDWQPAGEPT